MSAALWIYHRLPYRLKCLAASRAGARLKRLRYGSESEQWVQEALRRDAWDAEAWRGWQAEQLQAFLARAAARVPYYRDHFAERGRAAPSDLRDWPVLTKNALQASPASFVADDRRQSELFEIRTSGTTGTPLTLFWSTQTTRAWYALYEARIRRWNGVTRHDRWGILGGQLVSDARRTRPPYWVWNGALNQLYLSAYHIGKDTAADYVGAMRAHRLEHVLGYPSALAALAHFGLAAGLASPEPAVVVTNAEPLDASQREDIEAFFGCPLRNTYGMAEAVAGASECEHGAMHVWPDAGIIEVLDEDGAPVEPGTPGRLVLTGLLHDAMPLIRYDIGDVGALSTETSACPCGRLLPRMGEIQGRADDVVQTPDGRRIGRLDPVFKDDLPITEAQIEQVASDRLVVRVVHDGGFHESDATRIKRRLRERVGDMHVEVIPVDAIPRGPRGKFRAVINRVPQPAPDP